MGQEQALVRLLQGHPQIRYALRGSPEYLALRQAYILDNPRQPLAIVRPQSAEDVAALVSHAVLHKLELTVRSGGHDLFGRCFAQNALAIDMRDIAFVKVAEDKTTAAIGGGVLASQLVEQLGAYGLATAIGSMPSLGWIGWATFGGYGPTSPQYGLGLDQILAATVVTAEGKIVIADSEMLAAIRGAGGCVGVIVGLTIKVYPLDKVLGGGIAFHCTDVTATFSRFRAGLDKLVSAGLPDALSIQQGFINTPMGKCVVAGFFWCSDDIELGRQWQAKIESLGDVMRSDVHVTTVKDFLEAFGSFVPTSAYGANCTVSVRKITDELIGVIGEHIEKMPDNPSTLFSIHELRGKATSSSLSRDSVFGPREPHFVFEFIATSVSPELSPASWKWATEFREAVHQTSQENVLASTYISLTPPADADFPAMFGGNWERLVGIKRRYDPDNVFSHALVQFQGLS